MKIYGIGTDIVSVDRIKKSLKNKNFLKRLFCEEEILKCSKLINSIIVMQKDLQQKKLFQKH
jgi:phosphopantetheinyl transferase (holo-ACP synthase)